MIAELEEGLGSKAMQPSDSVRELKLFFQTRGVSIEMIDLRALVEAVLDFYRLVPAVGLADPPDQDMMLFQFGTYNWGEGDWFEFDLTRQFVSADGVDDDAISQLRCTVYYTPTDELRHCGSGSCWCSVREGLSEFAAMLLNSSAYEIAQKHTAMRLGLRWGHV